MMSRWLVRSVRKVNVLSNERFGTGRRELEETDAEDGTNVRGVSAIDSQCMIFINSETSEGKFLGYMVRTSPGT